MVTYIYFVKCPDCEDELFDFFDEAKDYAMGCLTKKPIITQTEVRRNDFGECTDHCDLGTVWSWEDECEDAEGGYTDAEPAVSIFTKDDLKLMADGKDPEFDNIDNSLDVEVAEPETSEVSAIDEVPDNFRKPIPEGMTIEQLVEEMEENEDTVECTWCNDLFDKSECRKEVNLGWLCSRCEAAIKSRGETLTFKENNYWDFLDEDTAVHDLGNTYDGGYPAEYDLATLVKDSISHLTDDLGKDPWAEDFADDVCADLENNYYIQVPEDPEKYGEWFSAVASEVSRQLNRENKQNLAEAAAPQETVDLEYDSLTITMEGRLIPSSDWREPDSYEEFEHTDSYTYTVDKEDVATYIWEDLLTEEDVADVPGGFSTLEDSAEWEKFLESHFDSLFEKYYNEILAHFEEDAANDFQANYTYSDYVWEREAEEADRQYDEWRDHQLFDEELKEEVDPDRNVSIVILVNEALNHLIREQGKSPAVDGFIDEVIAYIAEQQPTYVPKDRAGYQEWWNMVAKEISLQLNKFKLFEGSCLEELEEAADYHKRLTLCPECGTDQAFDHETGFCLSCGFNI